MEPEEVLQDRADRPVVRHGGTVRRPAHPWSPTVRALLVHLHEVGFTRAPQVLPSEPGWDVLTYLEGEAGPSGWAKVVDERGLAEFARMLRDYHQAVAEWRPREELTWYDGSTGAGGAGEIVCHGDYGPWNVVWRDTTPTGLLDWEYARVAPPAYDVYYALQYVAPFRSDEECLQWLGYSAPPDRRRRTEIFLTSYGWTGPADVFDEVIAVQRETHAKVEQLAALGYERQRTALAEGEADQVGREIAWAEQHRGLFSRD